MLTFLYSFFISFNPVFMALTVIFVSFNICVV